MKRLLLAFGLCMASLLLPAASSAQENSSITGIVTDQSGAVVPNAPVTLTAQATGQTYRSVSNTAGIYNFPNLGIGQYTLTVRAPGFREFTRSGIQLNVATAQKEDVQLVVGTADQQVTVKADALRVQTETSEVGSLITGSQITQLATNGRNILALTTLGAGVSTTMPAFNGVDAQGSSFSISFNGMRPDHNEWLIDNGEVGERGSGGKLILMPTIDALAEFRILSSN